MRSLRLLTTRRLSLSDIASPIRSSSCSTPIVTPASSRPLLSDVLVQLDRFAPRCRRLLPGPGEPDADLAAPLRRCGRVAAGPVAGGKAAAERHVVVRRLSVRHVRRAAARQDEHRQQYESAHVLSPLPVLGERVRVRACLGKPQRRTSNAEHPTSNAEVKTKQALTRALSLDTGRGGKSVTASAGTPRGCMPRAGRRP